MSNTIDEMCDAITAAITPIIEASNAYLEEVKITPVGKSKLLTVVVDSETHLSLDQVTVISKGISEIVELLPVLGENPFTLEVTSPGIDRPLTLARHWRKNKGRLVKVAFNDGSTIAGRIGECKEDSVLVDEKSILISKVKRAQIEIEFKSLSEDSE